MEKLNLTDGHEKTDTGLVCRLLSGFGAHMAGQVLYVMHRLVLPPLFLNAWGTAPYGDWLILTSAIAYLSLSDLGAQLYISNRLTQAYSPDDPAQFRKILHTGMGLFLLFPALVLAAVMGVMFFLPMTTLLKLTTIPASQAYCLMGILAFQIFLSLPLGILTGVYKSAKMLARGELLSNLIVALQIVLMGLGLLARGEMLVIACLQGIPHVLVGIYVLWDLNRRFSEFTVLSLKHFDVRLLKTFIKPSLHFFAIQVALFLSVQGMVVVAGQVLTILQVVVYATMRTMIGSLGKILGVVSHTAWPELTRLDANNDTARLQILFRVVLRSSLVGAFGLAVVFHFWGEWIYRVWLNAELAYHPALMDLFLLYAIQATFWQACRNFLMAINRHEHLARLLLVTAVITVAAGYTGGYYWGAMGLVGGMVVADLCLPFWFVPYLLGRHRRAFSPGFFCRETLPVFACMATIVCLPIPGLVMATGLVGWWACCLPGKQKLMASLRGLIRPEKPV